jgi:hypothetical protein
MNLSETWFVEGTIDFELQKYRLLAYLQEVDACFHESKLYPQLSDLIFHYNNLTAFRKNKQFLQESFPRRADKLDIERAEIIYERMLADDELMNELEDITAYAEGRMKRTIGNGTALYEQVEEAMQIEPVGIMPPYKSEGYLLLRWGSGTETRAYTYTVTLFEHGAARYKGLKMQYINAWPHSFSNTAQSIKQEIIRSHTALHNPAVYAVHTPLQLPLTETILPVAKRIFVKYLALQEGVS